MVEKKFSVKKFVWSSTWKVGNRKIREFLRKEIPTKVKVQRTFMLIRNRCVWGGVGLTVKNHWHRKVPLLQSPSSHGSSKLLLCAHSSPPWQLLVLVLMQFASQPDHSLHSLKQNIHQYFVQGLLQELSKTNWVFLSLRYQQKVQRGKNSKILRHYPYLDMNYIPHSKHSKYSPLFQQ